MENKLSEKQIDSFKKDLLEEKELLGKELETVSVKNPSVEGDWVPDVEKTDDTPGDLADQSSHSTEYEKNGVITAELEKRYLNIEKALDKIKSGTYGICEKSGNQIELERLKANPAARTCIKHKDEEDGFN